MRGRGGFLTVQEVAQLLNVRVQTLRKWIAMGKIPSVKVGRACRIDPQELESWINERRRSERHNESHSG